MPPANPPTPPLPAPTRARRSDAPASKGPPYTLYLVLAGLFALLFLALMFVGLFVGLNKAKEYGYDPQLAKKYPALAGFVIGIKNTSMAEEIEIDPEKGIVTFREKRSQKKYRVQEINGVLKRETVGSGEAPEEIDIDGSLIGEPQPESPPKARPNSNPDEKF